LALQRTNEEVKGRGGECVLRIPDSQEFPLGRKAHMERT